MYNGIQSFNDRYAPKIITLDKFASVNQVQAGPRTSDRYKFIPTMQALTVLADYGWQPVAAMEARTRKEENQGYQKHAIRLMNDRFNKEMMVGSTLPQLMLTNSHAGTSCFELSLAFFEKVCTNGLCVYRGDASTIRVRHMGYEDLKMEGAVREMVGQMPETLALTDTFKQMQLAPAERLALAEAAIELRWNGEEYAVDPQSLLYTRRAAERDPNLWNTFNVVQEHVIKGGVPQRNVKAGSKQYGKTSRARKVNSVSENIKLNRALWALTEKMAELKRS